MNDDIFLEDYKQRSIFQSNCIEFWAPVTPRLVPNVWPDRYYVSTFGNTFNTNTGRPIGLSMHRKGYKQFAMMTTDHKQITKKLHRIIMFTFCYFPGCEEYEVNHIDGNKLNNNLYNLEWATSSENTIHAINHGLKTVFGNSVEVILTDDDVAKILELRDVGLSPFEIVRILNIQGVTEKLVANICNGACRVSYHKRIQQ